MGTRLPRAFLRGCGVEDDVLTFVAERPDHADRFYSVFISYSHNDRAFAAQLHDKLQALGVRCWLDERRMRPGDDIYDEVDKGIREHERILLCASESSLSSWWVDAEIDSAFAKERELLQTAKIRSPVLIPINLDNYMFSERWHSGKRRMYSRGSRPTSRIPAGSTSRSQNCEKPSCARNRARAQMDRRRVLRVGSGSDDPAVAPGASRRGHLVRIDELSSPCWVGARLLGQSPPRPSRRTRCTGSACSRSAPLRLTWNVAAPLGGAA